MIGDDEAARMLRRLVVVAGVGASVVFIPVGLYFRLQTYGDGSIFSYAVAVEDVWRFHWRNIVVRATVWLFNLLPGELAVAATGSPAAGVFVYGALSFSMQAVGLFATARLDRTQGRLFFFAACASTALLCPLVFGFPTEMLVAHALFWPTLACAFGAPRTGASAFALFALTLALVFSHEAALPLAFGIVAALALRSFRDPGFLRALACFVAAAAIWFAADHVFPPDAYFAEVRARAAGEFFDARSLAFPELRLIGVALAAYAIVGGAFRFRARGTLAAALAVLAGLAIRQIGFDDTLHADARYYARTILLIGASLFAFVACLAVLAQEGAPIGRLRALERALVALRSPAAARGMIGAMAIVLCVHVTETIKFLAAWTDYRAAVRTLATGAAADPALGAPFFVSSRRIAPALDRLAWFSTTPYLSALVADFRPTRLVIDPAGNYFWITCAIATANAAKQTPVPAATRDMIRVYACAHPR
ncbi:MAG: hypothetical protein KGM42_07830 [Hyphomicrobiales bacterium]|nr:hypothetical protein [Hyphomicrobiales bacterium]